MSKTAFLAWTDPSDPNVTGIEVSMRVQVAAGQPVAPWGILGVIPVGQKADSVPDLVQGGYDFRLVSVNATERGADEVIVSGSFTEGTGTPPPPTGLAPVTGASVRFA